MGGALKPQLILSEIWREEVLSLLHKKLCCGHLDIHRTTARVKARFY